MIEILNKLFLASFGLAVGFGFLALTWRRVAKLRWRPLAEVYGKVRETPIAQLKMQTLIIHGVGPAFHSYRGTGVVGACRTGVQLSLLPPWSLFHKPVFIPYSDLSAQERQWFLYRAVEITPRKAPQTKIVVYPELWVWIAEQDAANYEADDRYYSSSRPTLAHSG